MICRVCLKDKTEDQYESLVYAKAVILRGNPVCIQCEDDYPSKAQKKSAFRKNLKQRTKIYNQTYGIDKNCKQKSTRKIMENKEDFRKKLLENCTKAEMRMAYLLDEEKIPYEFQKIIGPYFADFTFGESKLILEIDGEYHETKKQVKKDSRRTIFLESQGYRVIRFTNEQVFHEGKTCIQMVIKAMSSSRSSEIRRYLSSKECVSFVPAKRLEVQNLDYNTQVQI